MPFTETNPLRPPDEFEINDALESMRQIGGQVAHIYTLSVRRAGEHPNIPRHVTGAGKFKEDISRLKGSTGSCIIYKVEEPIVSWKIYSFFPAPSVETPASVSGFDFRVSSDGQNFEPAKFSRHDYFTGKGDYNYYLPVLYTSTEPGADKKYLKIEYMGEAQISRVEIKYGKHN
jgi:hypothetical protein